MKVLISLFDHSGNWSRPFEKAGWEVIQHDIKTGQDIISDSVPAAIEDNIEFGQYADGIIAALPCTDFAGSGARWWKDKDNTPGPWHKDMITESVTEFSVILAQCTLFIIELLLKPGGFWTVENPVGRLHKLVPEIGKPKMYFNPCDFGDPYTKKTALYGDFNTKLYQTPVLPLEGSKMHSQYGGKSERTKELRSITPKGFAKAFFHAHQDYQSSYTKIYKSKIK